LNENLPVLDLKSILVGLFGGLTFFLYGMHKMTDSMKSVAGDKIKNALSKLTTNRFKAAAAGATVTAIIQSSSVTTLLVVGFVSAGLMSVPQSVGIIMGANIGTTITAQVIAFKVTEYALVMITIGFALTVAPKSDRIRNYGTMTRHCRTTDFTNSCRLDRGGKTECRSTPADR
jgi:phosphate:Na+ symporter